MNNKVTELEGKTGPDPYKAHPIIRRVRLG